MTTGKEEEEREGRPVLEELRVPSSAPAPSITLFPPRRLVRKEKGEKEGGEKKSPPRDIPRP